MRETSPRIVAHRGASGEYPEHTLAAYQAALDQGADGLECDVRLTRDHELVCVHDRTVDRTSDGTGAVSEITLEELSELDFGSWHPRGTPSPVLTLQTLLELTAQAARPLKLFIETKHPVRFGGLVEQLLLAQLHRFSMASPASAAHSPVVVMSFSLGACWRIRRNAPLLPTVLLGQQSRMFGGGVAAAVGATAIGPSVASVREHPDLVDRAASAGRATYCWTVDDLADAQLCIDAGVDWIATNYPGARWAAAARTR